jgi:CDP-diacylglycerol--serine O-phosphatidyltransferase
VKAFIPNGLTTLNLIFGIFSILCTLNNEFFLAGCWIVAAMVADGLDGRAARYFNVSGEFGKELDSLCDLVSFGAAPAILAYAVCLKDFGWGGYVLAALFAACGAFRLARFNVNASTVKGHFVGLPIPAGGCLVATFVMAGFQIDPNLFAIMVALVAYLMVSTIKHPDFKGKGEKTRKIPLAVTVLICAYLLFLNQAAIVFVPFFGFSLFGILNTLFGVLDKKSDS